MLRFFRRWRKYSTLHRLSREFGVHYGQPRESVEALLRQGEEDDRLLDELYSLVETDRECSALMAFYSADGQALQQLLWGMMKEGAGQWAGKVFIPFWALAEPWTLRARIPASTSVALIYQHRDREGRSLSFGGLLSRGKGH